METEEKSIQEKRKHKRFLVKDRTFVMLGPDATQLCHVVDISRGGLSFRYFIESKKLFDEYMELGILSGDNFYLENISVQNISDREIKNESSFSSIIMRRRGIKFDHLTPFQESQLEHLLRNNTLLEP